MKGDEEDEAEEANQQPMEEVVVVRDRRLERLQDKPVSREEALRRRRERMAELVEEGEEEGVREVHPRQTPLGGGDLEEEEEDEEEEMDEEDREAELRRKQLRLQVELLNMLSPGSFCLWISPLS